MMVLRPEGVECSAKIAMSVLTGVPATMCLLPDCDLRRRIFLGPDACEVVNHDVGSRTGFTAPKPESASSFGNEVSHHWIISAGWASRRRFFVAQSRVTVDYSSATATAPGIGRNGENPPRRAANNQN
jgi:hypothetical protein